jgi:Integrase zinc binding domain
MLPSGEFQVTIPALGDLLLPISIVCDTPLLEENLNVIDDEDATILRKGEVIRLKDNFSTPLSVATAESLPQTIQFDELRYEQERDAECSDVFNQRGELSPIDINDDGLLVRKAPLDGVEQIVIPLSLRGRLLHLAHYPKTAGRPGVTRVFRSMRKRFFWRSMYTDVAAVVRNFSVCAQNFIKERSMTSFLKLFPASEPL